MTTRKTCFAPDAPPRAGDACEFGDLYDKGYRDATREVYEAWLRGQTDFTVRLGIMREAEVHSPYAEGYRDAVLEFPIATCAITASFGGEFASESGRLEAREILADYFPDLVK